MLSSHSTSGICGSLCQLTLIPSHTSHRWSSAILTTSQCFHWGDHAVFSPINPGRPRRHARVHSQNQWTRQAQTAQDVQPGYVQFINGQLQQLHVQVPDLCIIPTLYTPLLLTIITGIDFWSIASCVVIYLNIKNVCRTFYFLFF